MSAFLDIIGSYVFKAAMVAIILSTSLSLNNVMIEKSQITNLEKNVNVGLSVVEWDFRNIGYNTFVNPFVITSAQDLQYNADVDNDQIVDLVRWHAQAVVLSIGDSSVTRYELMRTVSGTSTRVMNRLRSVSFQYLDGTGAVTSTSSAIRGVTITIEAESSVVVNNSLLTTRRSFTVYPANLSLV